MVLGPPCSSYVWVNRATNQRSEKHPYGNERSSFVELGSLILGTKWKLRVTSHINSLIGFLPTAQDLLPGLTAGHHRHSKGRVHGPGTAQ